jgi:hypothetical protein
MGAAGVAQYGLVAAGALESACGTLIEAAIHATQHRTDRYPPSSMGVPGGLRNWLAGLSHQPDRVQPEPWSPCLWQRHHP